MFISIILVATGSDIIAENPFLSLNFLNDSLSIISRPNTISISPFSSANALVCSSGITFTRIVLIAGFFPQYFSFTSKTASSSVLFDFKTYGPVPTYLSTPFFVLLPFFIAFGEINLNGRIEPSSINIG